VTEAATENKEARKPGVDQKYREKYGKARSVNDALAQRLKEYLYPDGAKKVDADRLAKLCKDNSIDQSKYSHLNTGMQRMTVGNILRQRHAKGETVTIGGKKFA